MERLHFQSRTGKLSGVCRFASRQWNGADLYPRLLTAPMRKRWNCFWQGIGFLDIPDLVQAAMEHQPDTDRMDLEAVLQADREARCFVEETAG